MATIRITCDNCGAPLQYSEGETALTCPHCHRAVTLKIKPKEDEAHYKLGVDLYNKGLRDKAIQEYREAIRINPNNAEAHYSLGVALYNKRLRDEAMREFAEAVRINPKLHKRIP